MGNVGTTAISDFTIGVGTPADLADLILLGVGTPADLADLILLGVGTPADLADLILHTVGTLTKKKRPPGFPGRSIRREKNVLSKNRNSIRERFANRRSIRNEETIVFRSAPHFESLPRFL
ncbi:hypothetical protein [Leptospira kmetyi]|uniref:hypothetical protein n=1 Tax=Leptospira kmetyi TaxID=408139 RepID=UPI0013FDB366|nr:hypothetical protein [Leptospira kmetyi]